MMEDVNEVIMKNKQMKKNYDNTDKIPDEVMREAEKMINKLNIDELHYLSNVINAAREIISKTMKQVKEQQD